MDPTVGGILAAVVTAIVTVGGSYFLYKLKVSDNARAALEIAEDEAANFNQKELREIIQILKSERDQAKLDEALLSDRLIESERLRQEMRAVAIKWELERDKEHLRVIEAEADAAMMRVENIKLTRQLALLTSPTSGNNPRISNR